MPPFKVTLLLAIAAVSLVTGGGMDSGGLFLPVGVVLLLLVLPPTFPAVAHRYRLSYGAAGVVITILAAVGMLSSDPTPARGVAAAFFFVVGALLIAVATLRPLAARCAWLPPGRATDPSA